MKFAKIIFIFLFLSINLWLFSNTLEVGLEDNFLYHEIQHAIDESTHGDTILVHPGHYVEPINFIGKSITLASLYLESGNRDYIKNTIIDANEETSTVKFYNSEDRNSVLCGFTITGGSGWNGSGTVNPEDDFYGGGVFIKHSSPYIRDCIIEGNYADGGGGIYVWDYTTNHNLSYPLFEQLTVRNNWGKLGAGGIFIRAHSRAEFSSERRCSIYDNYSPLHFDFNHPMSEDEPNYIEVYLDTITVNQPMPYHYRLGYEGCYVFDWQNYKYEAIEEDVYVSPDGDNSNSGTSVNSPLKNLHIAINRIYPTENNPLTVHIATGNYSQSTNGDLFPLCFRDNFNLVGAGREVTILDAQYNSEVLVSFDGFTTNSTLEGLTITGGIKPGPSGGAVRIYGPQNVELTNLKFLNNKSISMYSALFIGNGNAAPSDSCNVVLENIIFEGNLGNYTIMHMNCDVYAENIIIQESGSNPDAPNDFGGWGLYSLGSYFKGYRLYEEQAELTFVNSHFYNNNSYSHNQLGATLVGMFEENLDVNFINCTFAGNNVNTYGNCVLIFERNVNLGLHNCIFSNNNEFAIGVGSDDLSTNSIVCNNTIFESDALAYNCLDTDLLFAFDTTNVIYGDPLFEENEESPHRLSAESPCVDSGEIPEGFEMPFYDLAGNERVMGYGIDMGCFESDFTDAEEGEIPYISGFNLTNYPNPFNPVTNIYFNLEADSNVELTIYNIKGQKIITLINKKLLIGHHSIIWDATDENNKSLSSGIYIYKLKTNNQESIKRMILLK